MRRERWRTDWVLTWLVMTITACGSLAPSMGTCAAPAASARPEPLSSFSIRWTSFSSESNRFAVEVSGVSQGTLGRIREANWKAEQWQRVFAVYAEQGDLLADIGLPAMLGVYRVEAGTIRFEPQFPLDPAIKYRAVFQPENLPGAGGVGGGPMTAAFRIPSHRLTPTTVVSQVYPSGNLLPENLLKFYVHFSAAMSGGHIYEHIHLRDESGREVELPFLEIAEELWNPEMNRLTLFIDPGRIKRGVRPLEEIGPSLEAGKSYTLVLDREWKDAGGLPLRETFQKKFQVGPPDREAPDPARWKIEPPQAGTREPLKVTFPKSMDHALAQRVIRVARVSGELVEGNAELEDQERRWKLTPVALWSRGRFNLIIQTTIEDLAGNNIGKPFEVDLFDGVQRRATNSTVKLPFEVR